MRLWWLLGALVLLHCLWCTVAEDSNENYTLREQVKILNIQLKALTSKHNVEIQALKKDIVEIRGESLRTPVSTASTPNQVRNNALTMKWLQNILNELKTEIVEIQTGYNVSELIAEQQRMRNELNVMFSEAANVAEQVEANGAHISRMETKLEDIVEDINTVRRIAGDAKASCSKLSNEVKFSNIVTKYNNKILSNHYNKRHDSNSVENEENIDAEKVHIKLNEPDNNSAKRYRHLHFIRKQIQGLEHSYRRLTDNQEEIKSQLVMFQQHIENKSCKIPTNLEQMLKKVEMLEGENANRKQDISNISNEVSGFNKLHVSMLQLLESIENLENKIDKSIPEIQNEVSKLDIDIAQLISKHAYLKEDQENIRQSVKAIAVSVSNTADKLGEDHQLVVQMNKTAHHLQILSKQHFYRLNDHILKSESFGIESNISSSELPELVGEIKDLRVIKEEYQKEFQDIVNRLPYDCSAVDGPSGVYLIAPGLGTPIETYCEKQQTLIQNRFNGSVDFNHSYKDYATGFGSPSTEFWIGNDALFRLTRQNCSSLAVELTDIYGKKWLANYSNFSVGPESDGYRLNVDGYSGNASDALDYQNNMQFSTFDHDSDISNTHCAGNYEGGWWFSHCQHANLNGKYTLGLTWFDSSHNEWIAVASSKLMLLPRYDCIPEKSIL